MFWLASNTNHNINYFSIKIVKSFLRWAIRVSTCWCLSFPLTSADCRKTVIETAQPHSHDLKLQTAPARKLVRPQSGGQTVHAWPPSSQRSVGVVYRLSNRICSQSSTSASTHPTRFEPSCTRLGNRPAFSKRAMCCGEYKTNSFSWRFESIRITISPRLKSIAMPKVYDNT